jgi:hypothetical protein
LSGPDGTAMLPLRVPTRAAMFEWPRRDSQLPLRVPARAAMLPLIGIDGTAILPYSKPQLCTDSQNGEPT